MEEKQEYRKIYKTLRSGMTRHDVDSLSARICSHILESGLYSFAQYIYAYYPLDCEADVRLVAQTAWQDGKHVAFPKVSGDEMDFFEVTDFGQLAEGTYGILEPAEGCMPVNWLKEGRDPSGREPESSLLVLIPGVAFDWQGTRMGRGKGYYDRYFADLKGLNDSMSDNNLRGASVDAPLRVNLLGVAYACQIADRLPAERHDLRVSYVVTERGIISFDQS